MTTKGHLLRSTFIRGFDGGTDGEGDAPPIEFDLSKLLADAQAKVALLEWAEREVAKPLKTKNEELLGKLVKYKVKAKNDKGEEIEVYIDPDEAKTAIGKVKDMKPPQNVEEEVSRAVSEANSRSKAQLDAVQTELTNYKTQAERERALRHDMMVGNVLQQALLSANIKPAKMPLHSMYLKGFLAIDNEGGSEKIVVVDQQGNIRYGSSGPMSVAEMIAEYRERAEAADDFAPTANAGSGTTPGGVRGGRSGGFAIPDNLPPQERMKIARRIQSGTGGRQ